MYVCPWALQEPYGDKGEGSWLSSSKALSLTGKQCQCFQVDNDFNG